MEINDFEKFMHLNSKNITNIDDSTILYKYLSYIEKLTTDMTIYYKINGYDDDTEKIYAEKWMKNIKRKKNIIESQIENIKNLQSKKSEYKKNYKPYKNYMKFLKGYEEPIREIRNNLPYMEALNLIKQIDKDKNKKFKKLQKNCEHKYIDNDECYVCGKKMN